MQLKLCSEVGSETAAENARAVARRHVTWVIRVHISMFHQVFLLYKTGQQINV